MATRIQQEILSTSPDVPFRASTSHAHDTWAKTFHSFPEFYVRPQTLEEIQKIVNLARKCRRRIVVVGSGHSPSDLTCSSSWMVNLDDYNRVLTVDTNKKTLLVEAGIRVRQLNIEANKHGLTIPNLGSIDEQSIAGATATGTHGSSLKHGLLSDNIRSLRIVLANGRAVRCSPDQNHELFRAALLSLGALGIITEVEYQMTDACNIEWTQSVESLSKILETWDTTLWTQKEFTRVWWMPYMKRAIKWSAEKTDKSLRPPKANFYGGAFGYHLYHNLLYVSNYVPSILPWVEWFVFGLQYGFSLGNVTSAVEPLQTGLLMNCLYSQFVNEWAIPLAKGPEALRRLSAWINDEPDSGIPFSVKGLYVHCPVEVRVSNTNRDPNRTRPFLDNTPADGPTLYLNATLYRPHLRDPPCTERYYEAFEWLMKELGGRPHYAKNFQFTSSDEMRSMLGKGFSQWERVRNEADPEGMFLGEWHHRTLGLGKETAYPLGEREVSRRKVADGGQLWTGALTEPDGHVRDAFVGAVETRASSVSEKTLGSPSASSSTSSFDMMHAAETERSTMFDLDDEEDDELTDRDERRR